MKKFLINFWRVVSHSSSDGIRLFVVCRFFMLQFLFRLKKPASIKFLDKNITFDFKKTGSTSTYYHGLNEPHDMMFLGKLLNSKFSFIDVGANIGIYTLLSSITGVKKTIALEPDLANFKELKSNTNKWGCNNVDILNYAVGDNEGYVLLHGDDVAAHVTDFSEENLNNNRVKCIRLDQLIPDIKGSKVVLKIDTEGYEHEILLGSEELFQLDQVHSVLVEINTNNIKTGASSSIITFLSNLGYKPCRYDIEKEKLILVDGYNKEQDNTIFIKNENFIEFNNYDHTSEVLGLLKKQRKKIFNFTYSQ
jgi:FkbM family methyltransferase